MTHAASAEHAPRPSAWRDATATDGARLAEQITEHLVGVISTTRRADDPFAHLVLQQPWPAAIYGKLLDALPADTYYRELRHSDAMLPDGRSARLQFPLLGPNIARLPTGQREVWQDVASAVQSPEVIGAFKSRFADVLSRVTGRLAERIRLRPYLTLFRDLGGYRISIHPDSPRKAITAQFYLPQDDRQLHLGTRFHRRNADGSFALAQAMRFAPNSGYAFAVTPDSYHGVEPMQPQDLPRNSLMLIVTYDRGPLVEGFKQARAFVRATYDQLRGGGGVEQGEGRYEKM